MWQYDPITESVSGLQNVTFTLQAETYIAEFGSFPENTIVNYRIYQLSPEVQISPRWTDPQVG